MVTGHIDFLGELRKAESNQGTVNVAELENRLSFQYLAQWLVRRVLPRRAARLYRFEPAGHADCIKPIQSGQSGVNFLFQFGQCDPLRYRNSQVRPRTQLLRRMACVLSLMTCAFPIVGNLEEPAVDGDHFPICTIHSADAEGAVLAQFAKRQVDAALLPEGGGVLCALHRRDSFLVLQPTSNGVRTAAYRWNGFGFSGVDNAEVLNRCRAMFEVAQ